MGVCLSYMLADAACCAASSAVKCCCCTIPWRTSTISRFMYTAFFILATIVAFLVNHFGYTGRYPITRNVDANCDANCAAFLSVQRISLGIVIFHSFMALVTAGVSDAKSLRGRFQNALWPIKLAMLGGTILGMFWIPNDSLRNYWIAAMIFSAVFILLQAVILVNVAWDLATSWMTSWEETGANAYKYLLIGSTFLGFSGIITITALLYEYFTKGSGCGLNIFFITFNLILCVAQAGLSVSERVQESNPKSGILQAALLSLYTTYLVASAIASEPNDPNGFHCAPLTGPGDSVLANATLYSGIAFAFLSLGYAAFSAGSQTWTTSDTPAAESGDDESSEATYNYALFHLTFVIAAFYMSTVLTNWQSTDFADNGMLSINSGMTASWVKMATSWVISLLYVWTLVGPLLLPDRDWN